MKTKIEWATDVWNPVTGCTKVSEGCRNCYAERMVKRFGGQVHGFDQLPSYPEFQGPGDCDPAPFSRVIFHPEKLDQPLHWRKPRRVFVCSMSDLFHPDVPDEFICRVWHAMHTASQHTFMVLTKRPRRMLEFCTLPEDMACTPSPNVWLGVSIENQATADERIPLLLQTPAAVRFVSCEPMLGPVDLSLHLRTYPSSAAQSGLVTADMPAWTRFGTTKLDWVITGGESGPGARPMHPDWARSLRDQCAEAVVPFFFKQWGEWAPTKMLHESGVAPGNASHPWGICNLSMTRIGKKAAGRNLDGMIHDAFPGVRP